MPHTIAEFQDTPNPNALKCILEPAAAPIDGSGPRSYQSREAAAKDPLAAAVMGVPGVVGVLILQGWMTVNKAPDAQWKTVKAAVKKVLADAP